MLIFETRNGSFYREDCFSLSLSLSQILCVLSVGQLGNLTHIFGILFLQIYPALLMLLPRRFVKLVFVGQN